MAANELSWLLPRFLQLDRISQEELEKVRDRLKKKIKKEEKTKSEDEDGGKEEATDKKKRRYIL